MVICVLSVRKIFNPDVLNDASAGAIYGTRAAGGVILVTTKKAKEGPITLSYTGRADPPTSFQKTTGPGSRCFREVRCRNRFGSVYRLVR